MLPSNKINKTHHSQQIPALFEGGTAPKDASDHDHHPSHHQDVSSCRVCAGGEQADVVTLLSQGPDAHCHHGPTSQLERERSKQMKAG